MADQQAGGSPPEPLSHDADVYADATAAYHEVADGGTEPSAPERPEPPQPSQQPSEQPKPDHPTDDRRYADGTFKPTKDEQLPAGQQGANEQQAKAAAEVPGQPPQPQAQAPSGPPSSWSVPAKAAWEALPDPVRAAIVKREVEIEQGRSQYADVAELREYAQMARSGGQSPREVIERYIGAEQHLRQDFLGGMIAIGQNMGYSPQQIAQAMAQRYLGQSNGQTTEGSQQPYYDPAQGSQTPAADPALYQYINRLAQQQSNMEAYLQQQRQAEENRQMGAVKGVLERVSSDPSYRYFANVEPEVVHALQLMNATGRRSGDNAKDLEAAYRQACLSNPEVSELYLKEQYAKLQAATAQQQREAAEKARHASRSITGSPSNGAPRDFGEDDGSVEAATKAAWRQHAGAG